MKSYIQSYIQSYILCKLDDERYTDIYDFCRQRQFDDGFEAEFSKFVGQLTYENCDGNSWRASYTMLIKHHIIKGYLEEIAMEEVYNEGNL